MTKKYLRNHFREMYKITSLICHACRDTRYRFVTSLPKDPLIAYLNEESLAKEQSLHISKC